VKFDWIHRHRTQFEVRLMCEALGVTAGGYYRWRDRPTAAATERRAQLVARIRHVHQASRGLYGSPRVYADLTASGVSVCENTVARYMREERIVSKVNRRRRFRIVTTDARHDSPVAANLLDRQFDAAAPDQKWCCDITYVPTAEGTLYLAAVIDCCTRKIIGWAMDDHLRAELCLDALAMAIERRRPPAGLPHHSDRGVQYASDAYRSFLADHGLVASMSRTGNCYDNALMESFFGTLKTELVHHETYATREHARRSIFEYIEVFYNRQRRHSAIGYQSPESFEVSLN
jgi:transposase InsO family protein